MTLRRRVYPRAVKDPRRRASVPFGSIEPGDPVGVFTYEVTPELVERHRRATEQEPYSDPALAPLSLLAADGVNLADRFWDISQSVHAGQRLEVHALARLGDVLTVAGTARAKFVKRGRRYIVSETRTTNQRGELVARGLTAGVLVYSEGGEGREPEGSGAAREDPGSRASAPREPVERTLGPLVRTMTREAMILYEPPGELNLHTSDPVARAAGLPAAIATGTLFLAYLFDLLHREYGRHSLVGTELDVRIRLPVFAGDRVEALAQLTGRSGGRLHHRVRCRGPRGDVIVGTASVLG
jgi:acyl dehydratase